MLHDLVFLLFASIHFLHTKRIISRLKNYRRYLDLVFIFFLLLKMTFEYCKGKNSYIYNAKILPYLRQSLRQRMIIINIHFKAFVFFIYKLDTMHNSTLISLQILITLLTLIFFLKAVITWTIWEYITEDIRLPSPFLSRWKTFW